MSSNWVAYTYTYKCVYIYIYEQGPPHTPPQPDGSPPCGRGGGVFSAAKPIVAGGMVSWPTMWFKAEVERWTMKAQET